MTSTIYYSALYLNGLDTFLSETWAFDGKRFSILQEKMKCTKEDTASCQHIGLWICITFLYTNYSDSPIWCDQRSVTPVYEENKGPKKLHHFKDLAIFILSSGSLVVQLRILSSLCRSSSNSDTYSNYH